jgi:hypothetical protein
MFLVTWLFDKLGYMPKISVESTWPFPAVAKPYTPHEFEQPIKKPTTKKAKTVKIPKATTRKSTKK